MAKRASKTKQKKEAESKPEPAVNPHEREMTEDEIQRFIRKMSSGGLPNRTPLKPKGS